MHCSFISHVFCLSLSDAAPAPLASHVYYVNGVGLNANDHVDTEVPVLCRESVHSYISSAECRYSSAAVHFCHWWLNLWRSLMEETDIRFVMSPELLRARRKTRQECYFFLPSAVIQQRVQRFTLQITGVTLETWRCHCFDVIYAMTKLGRFVCLSVS